MDKLTVRRLSYSEDECVWLKFSHIHFFKQKGGFFRSPLSTYRFESIQNREFPTSGHSYGFCEHCAQMVCLTVNCFIPKLDIAYCLKLQNDPLGDGYSSLRFIVYQKNGVYGDASTDAFFSHNPKYDIIGPEGVLFL